MGAEGQLLIGGFMAGLVGAYLHIGNPLLHKLVAFAVGASVVCAFRVNTCPASGVFSCGRNGGDINSKLCHDDNFEYSPQGPFSRPGAGYVTTLNDRLVSYVHSFWFHQVQYLFPHSFAAFEFFWFLNTKTEFDTRLKRLARTLSSRKQQVYAFANRSLC